MFETDFVIFLPVFLFNCSFLQVLAKSCKLVPVMIMGFFVSAKKYRFAEYVAVVLITSGVILYSITKVSTSYLDVYFLLSCFPATRMDSRLILTQIETR